jgi:hypothetical protein
MNAIDVIITAVVVVGLMVLGIRYFDGLKGGNQCERKLP